MSCDCPKIIFIVKRGLRAVSLTLFQTRHDEIHERPFVFKPAT